MTEMNARPTTWLTNLRKEESGVFISGVTSRQDNVVSLANILPLSKINKVVHKEIREHDFWVFEIVSQMPTIDWIGLMERELESLIAIHDADKDKTQIPEPVKSTPARKPVVTHPKPSPQTPKDTSVAKTITFGIRPIGEGYLLQASEDEVEGKNDPDVRAYWQFIDSVSKGNMWEYQDLGASFIQEYPDSPLLPIVRWRLAYRYYVDHELDLAWLHTSHLLQLTDAYKPYALLLAGRIELARKSYKYQYYYNILRKDYATHILMGQVNSDLIELSK